MIRLVADEGIAGLDALPGEAIQLTTAAGREIAPPLLEQADALWVRSVTPVDAGLLRDSPLRFVGTATAGVEHIDRAYLRARAIAFAAAPGANANAVVEYVLAALLALDRPWTDLERGETLGIVGMGAVGRRLAAVAGRLGWRVRCCDPYLGARAGELDGVVLEPFAALLGCRVLSLHPSLLVQGRWPSHHLLDESALAQLHAPQTLINTARGSVVDNRALDMHRIRRADPLPEGFDMEDDRPGAEAGLALSRRDEKVRAALDTLPERQRMAVMLCYFEGLSNAAAAEMLGLHLKALESLLVRARRRLRDALCDDRDDLLLPHV